MRAKTNKVFRIKVRDVLGTRCCHRLRKFIGMTRNAVLTPAGIYVFSFVASTGLTGMITETHKISPKFVEVLLS